MGEGEKDDEGRWVKAFSNWHRRDVPRGRLDHIFSLKAFTRMEESSFIPSKTLRKFFLKVSPTLILLSLSLSFSLLCLYACIFYTRIHG